MINQENRNPLRYYFVFCVVGTAVRVMMFIHELSTGDGLAKVLSTNKGGVLGVLLMLSFIISYVRKKELAWWIALFHLPIKFVCRTLEGHALSRERIVALIVFSLVVYYIISKYTAYKEYINGKNPSEILELAIEDDPGSHKVNQWYDPQNPLNALFMAALILGVIAWLNIIAGKVSIEDSQSIIGYFYYATKLSILFVFSLCYLKKSILAWWVALLYGPILLSIYFIFQPFQITTIVPLSIYAVAIWYLIVKYRAYKDYIAPENESERTSFIE